MIATIRACDVNGIWIQIIGYFSDEKLEVLKQVWFS